MTTDKMYNEVVDKYQELLRFVSRNSNQFDKKTQEEYIELLNAHIS